MNDLKSALRSLIKSPVFAIVTIVTVPLGIGLNSAPRHPESAHDSSHVPSG
jgi:hypothetical protein